MLLMLNILLEQASRLLISTNANKLLCLYQSEGSGLNQIRLHVLKIIQQ